MKCLHGACARPARAPPSSAAGTGLGMASLAAARLDRIPNPHLALHRALSAFSLSSLAPQRATHSIPMRDCIARRVERRHAVPSCRLTPHSSSLVSLRARSQVVQADGALSAGTLHSPLIASVAAAERRGAAGDAARPLSLSLPRPLVPPSFASAGWCGQPCSRSCGQRTHLGLLP